MPWWCNWSDTLKGGTASALRARYAMDFMPMVWNENFNDAAVTAMLQANPQISYLLALNEPNLNGQATRTPQQAADLWPRIEQIAAVTGVKIVEPQMTEMVALCESRADVFRYAWFTG